MTATIPAPEVIDDLPDIAYHSDRTSLSSSGARLLLPPSTPEKFRYAMDHPRPPKREYDFGHVAHRLILGAGSEIAIVDADSWRTNAAKAQADEARAANKVPVLAHVYTEAEAMAARVTEHPVAGSLLAEGRAEASVYATDPMTGTRLRARPDWMTNLRSGRLALVDYKTTTNAAPTVFAKSVGSYGYDMQADWYRRVCALASLGDDSAWLFIAQEKTAPYAVSVNELTGDDIRNAGLLNRRAIDTFARCTDTNHWPGWDSINLIDLPKWAVYEREDILNG